MITRFIRAKQELGLNTQIDRHLLSEGEEKSVRFKNEAQFIGLLALDLFEEVKNVHIPVVRASDPKVIKPEVKETVEEPLTEDMVDNVPELSNVSEAADTPSDISTDCPSCGEAMIVTGSQGDGKNVINSYQCPICQETLEIVVISNLIEPSDADDNAPEQPAEESQEEFVCAECGKTFKTLRGLKAHASRLGHITSQRD